MPKSSTCTASEKHTIGNHGIRARVRATTEGQPRRPVTARNIARLVRRMSLKSEGRTEGKAFGSSKGYKK